MQTKATFERDFPRVLVNTPTPVTGLHNVRFLLPKEGTYACCTIYHATLRRRKETKTKSRMRRAKWNVVLKS